MSDKEVEAPVEEALPDRVAINVMHCVTYLLDGDKLVMAPDQMYEGGPEGQIIKTGPVRGELLKSLEVEPDKDAVVVVDTEVEVAVVAVASLETTVVRSEEKTEEAEEVKEAPAEAVAEPRPRRL